MATRLATFTLGVAAVLALAGCSSASFLGFGDDCAVCEPAPAPAPAPEPCPPVQPTPVAQDPGQPPVDVRVGEVWCYIRVPAVTRTVEEQVMVTPASCRQEWVPPETQQVEERICVRQEERRRIPVPAVYETVSEQVMTCPARVEWRRVECEPDGLSQGEQLGECWTLCEIPPVYETRSRQVCVQQESCREEVVPAVFETQVRTVEVRPGYYRTVEEPAVYEMRYREEQVAPARWEWRRTRECEVPGMLCPPGGAPGPMAPAPSSDGNLPPAGGGFPQPDPFGP